MKGDIKKTVKYTGNAIKNNFLKVEIYNSLQLFLFRISSIASLRKTLATDEVTIIFGNLNILLARE